MRISQFHLEEPRRAARRAALDNAAAIPSTLLRHRSQREHLNLSRIELAPSTQLPRFNMALELGLFLGANLLSESKKPCLVMDTERYRYQRFCSDLSGFDPSAHGGDILQLICVVRDWLRANLEPNEKIPGGEHIFERYKLFLRHLREFCEEEHLNPDSISYYDYISSLQGWRRGKRFARERNLIGLVASRRRNGDYF